MGITMNTVTLSLLVFLCRSVTGDSCSAECRPSASCCSEVQCTGNEGDPDDLSYLTCPCMIPSASACVAPGDDLVLECDPGGDCLQHCTWDSPLGTCSWADGALLCPDTSITPVLSGGNCNIKISSADYRHTGVWKCKTVPSFNAFSDFLNVTVSSDCPNLSSSWWRTGWTAGLLWSGVGLLIIILIILLLTLIYCLCPAFCVCWRGSVVSEEQQVDPVQYSRVSKHRTGHLHSHEPAVLDETRQRSGYHRDHHHHHYHHQDVQYEVPRSVDYEVPRIYASSNTQMRTAKKKSNFDNIDLEERIRKASGVARQEQV